MLLTTSTVTTLHRAARTYAAVRELIEAETRQLDRAPLDDHQLADLADPAPDSAAIVATNTDPDPSFATPARGEQPASARRSTLGYAHVNRLADGWQLGLVGPIDLERTLDAVDAWLQRYDPAPLSVWLPTVAGDAGDQSTATLLARAFAPVRALHRLSHALPHPLADAAPRTSRAFADSDAAAFLELNGAAFAADPDQGAWDEIDLMKRRRAPWYRDDDFRVADTCLDGARVPGALAGCCWTKVDPVRQVGEIYVIAAHPACGRFGLGQALALDGMAHLHEQGLDRVELYVDSANYAALRLYRRLQFTTDLTLTCYRWLPPSLRHDRASNMTGPAT